MAIGADWRVQVALQNRLSVNAGHELRLLRFVTLGAGVRNIGFEDRGLRIACRTDVVRPVAIGADSSFVATAGNGLAVHTLLVGNERLAAQPGAFLDQFVVMAGGAGLGNVLVIDLGIGIAGWQDLVWTAVAVDTTRGLCIACGNGLGVIAIFVNFLLIGVTGCALRFCEARTVRHFLNIGMAIGTIEHHAVNGVLIGILLHLQTYLLTVALGRKRRVAMAGEAIVIRQLWSRGCFLRLCQSRPKDEE